MSLGQAYKCIQQDISWY